MTATVSAHEVMRDVVSFVCPFCRVAVVTESDEGACDNGHGFGLDYQGTGIYAVCEAL
jgi:hypothetical protein